MVGVLLPSKIDESQAEPEDAPVDDRMCGVACGLLLGSVCSDAHSCPTTLDSSPRLWHLWDGAEGSTQVRVSHHGTGARQLC